MDVPLPVQEALWDSITSGTFIDTKFWVFSKRSSKAGRVGEPRALYVNEHVVRSVPRLGALLDQKEIKENLRGQFPADKRYYTCDYDYDADSDLEEDEGWDSPNAGDVQVLSSKGKGNKSDSGTLVEIESSDMKSNESSDIISVSDVDSMFSAYSRTGTEATIASNPAHIGTVVVVEDVAFVTFQALLRYLYTKEIDFAQWGSPERRKARVLEEIAESHQLPKPSPKSIYRLADKYDIPELKELALRRIQHDLSKCDIVEEVFSKYTSRYPEIKKLELEHLAQALLSADSGPALDALKGKIKAYTRGELPHAPDVLPALYELMERKEPLKKAPTQSPESSEDGTTSGDWQRLKDELTRSLTSGSFLDSKFYALDFRPPGGATKIRPIYFCSMVDGTFSLRLTKHSSRIWPSGKTWLQRIDEYDSDLDDEVSEAGVPTDAHPHSACIPEDPLPTYKAAAPALVLKSGTAKTWSAIFFYLYTSQIAFAPVRSQGTPQRPKQARAPSSNVVAAVACSPKSVYALASKIDLARLCDLAFDNLKSQLNEKNIIQELFSPFTSEHECIRRMQHELLCSKLKSATEGSSLLEIVRSSSSGETPHRAASMELIFERSIREQKERIAAGTKESKPQSSPEKESKPQSPPEKSSPTDKKPVKVEPAPENREKRQPRQAGGSGPAPVNVNAWLAMIAKNLNDIEARSGGS